MLMSSSTFSSHILRLYVLIGLFFIVQARIRYTRPKNEDNSNLFTHPKLLDDKDNIHFHRWNKNRTDDDTIIRDGYIIVFNEETFTTKSMNVKKVSHELIEPLGGTIEFIYEHIFKGFAVRNMPGHIMKLLLDNVTIRYAARKRIFSLSMINQLNPTWGLDRIDQQTNVLDSKFTSSWDGNGVTIFIIDSGIRKTHSEFGNRVVCSFSAFSNYDSCSDDVGHGTHVAGIAAGASYGVAKNATIASVRVFASTGRTSTPRILAGIDHVIGVKKAASSGTPMVINMSLGGPFSFLSNVAVSAAVNAGIVVVAAAGNSNQNACAYSPGSAERVICVGSTTQNDEKSYFSNVGRCVDIFAPGSDIESSYIRDDTASATFSGTSMAAPFVSGAAALVLQKNTTFTPKEVKDVLINNALTDVIRFNSNRRSPNRLVNVENLR